MRTQWILSLGVLFFAVSASASYLGADQFTQNRAFLVGPSQIRPLNTSASASDYKMTNANGVTTYRSKNYLVSHSKLDNQSWMATEVMRDELSSSSNLKIGMVRQASFDKDQVKHFTECKSYEGKRVLAGKVEQNFVAFHECGTVDRMICDVLGESMGRNLVEIEQQVEQCSQIKAAQNQLAELMRRPDYLKAQRTQRAEIAEKYHSLSQPEKAWYSGLLDKIEFSGAAVPPAVVLEETKIRRDNQSLMSLARACHEFSKMSSRSISTAKTSSAGSAVAQ